MSSQRIVHQLEANLQTELSAKNQELEILARQEAAIASRDVDSLTRASAELAELLQRGADRAAKRAALLVDLARELGLPTPARLGSIAAALGPRGDSLAARRTELRVRCAATMRAGRRVAALVRMHSGLVEQALGDFLGPDPSGSPLGRGSLVDAEA